MAGYSLSVDCTLQVSAEIPVSALQQISRTRASMRDIAVENDARLFDDEYRVNLRRMQYDPNSTQQGRNAAMPIRWMTVVSLFLALTGICMPAQAAESLAMHRWKHRVLVVVAPSSQDRDLRAQRRIFQEAREGMAERNLVLVEAAGDDPSARAIRREAAVDGTRFQVLLIGKDGNIAAASGTPLTARGLFGKIDAMPMRRDEMRRRP
jgi:hypothetical protein